MGVLFLQDKESMTNAYNIFFFTNPAKLLFVNFLKPKS